MHQNGVLRFGNSNFGFAQHALTIRAFIVAFLFGGLAPSRFCVGFCFGLVHYFTPDLD